MQKQKPYKLVQEVYVLKDFPITGYEIHCEETTGKGIEKPLIKLDNLNVDGACSEDQQVCGTYLHGLFEQPESLTAFLKWAGLEADLKSQPISYHDLREQSINLLADTISKSLTLNQPQKSVK